MGGLRAVTLVGDSPALAWITIALAWLYCRLLLGIGLVAVAVGTVVGLKYAFGRKKSEDLPGEPAAA